MVFANNVQECEGGISMPNSDHMSNAFIEVVPLKNMRYPSGDDYFRVSNGMLHFRITDRPDKRHEWLDLQHAQVEQFLCELRGITIESVDEWDYAHLDTDDPGSLEGCPYGKEHVFANMICRQLAKEIEVDFDKYYNEELL